jgi:GTP-binding protein YchF
VRGASKGEGLGNQFLSHIREVDAIVQVVRCFEDTDVHHVSGSIDPIRDIDVINTELVLADLASVQKRLDRLQKEVRAGDKHAKTEAALCERLLVHLNEAKPAVTLPATPEEKALLRSFFLLSAKPTIFACNVGESDLAGINDNDASSPAAKHVKAVSSYVATHLLTEAVVISAQIESELAELPPSEATEYLSGLGVKQSGVDTMIRAVYHLLGLRTFFTTGEKESRAWTIHAGDKAPAAAGVIHSDFERGFIAAETVQYDDLIRLGSFAKAREAGKLRIEGKEYEVKDGDVMVFRFNV